MGHRRITHLNKLQISQSPTTEYLEHLGVTKEWEAKVLQGWRSLEAVADVVLSLVVVLGL